MKKVIFILAIAGIFIAYFTLLDGTNAEAYVASVQEIIETRVNYLQTSEQSPFKAHNVAFEEPSYFEIDPAFRINAKLQRLETRERLIIDNSDGTQTTYLKFAYAHFKFEGQDLRLLILKPSGLGPINEYFTGFADETSARTTYGGGRYLDLDIGKSNKVVIDFNLAYNPYCAYVDGYVCPLPPRENILPIAIRAGEKDYSH